MGDSPSSKMSVRGLMSAVQKDPHGVLHYIQDLEAQNARLIKELERVNEEIHSHAQIALSQMLTSIGRVVSTTNATFKGFREGLSDAISHNRDAVSWTVAMSSTPTRRPVNEVWKGKENWMHDVEQFPPMPLIDTTNSFANSRHSTAPSAGLASSSTNKLTTVLTPVAAVGITSVTQKSNGSTSKSREDVVASVVIDHSNLPKTTETNPVELTSSFSTAPSTPKELNNDSDAAIVAKTAIDDSPATRAPNIHFSETTNLTEVTEGRRLYINNLAYATTEQDIRSFLKGFLIEAISFSKNESTGQLTGYGFVDFLHCGEAERAITELCRKELLGRKIVMRLKVSAKLKPRWGTKGAFAHDASTFETATMTGVAQSRRLYINNLAHTTTEEDLRCFFKGFESITYPKSALTGLLNGFGFVDVSCQSEAERAVAELSGKELLQHKMILQLAPKLIAGLKRDGEAAQEGSVLEGQSLSLTSEARTISSAAENDVHDPCLEPTGHYPGYGIVFGTKDSTTRPFPQAEFTFQTPRASRDALRTNFLQMQSRVLDSPSSEVDQSRFILSSPGSIYDDEQFLPAKKRKFDAFAAETDTAQKQDSSKPKRSDNGKAERSNAFLMDN